MTDTALIKQISIVNTKSMLPVLMIFGNPLLIDALAVNLLIKMEAFSTTLGCYVQLLLSMFCFFIPEAETQNYYSRLLCLYSGGKFA